MVQAKQRIEEIKQLQRERIEGSRHTKTENCTAHNRLLYLFALGGVAVGLMLAAVVWLTKPLVMENDNDPIWVEAGKEISAVDFSEINANIARLNHRMELLADTISDMDAKFERIVANADSMGNVEDKDAYTLQELSADPADEAAEFDENNPDKPVVNNTEHTTEQAFVPTHRVNARINLRPSTSVQTTPIAVLDVGTEVEYISETDGWYYVKARSHGNGWCSSDYLSSL
jgi:hypothetical protein